MFGLQESNGKNVSNTTFFVNRYLGGYTNTAILIHLTKDFDDLCYGVSFFLHEICQFAEGRSVLKTGNLFPPLIRAMGSRRTFPLTS